MPFFSFNRRRWYGAVCGVALLWASAARSEVFYMDFPLRLNDAEVAQLSAGLENFALHSLKADELADKLKKQLSPSVLNWLKGLGERPVTVAELGEQGVSLTFLAQDMVLEMVLSEKAMATDSLTYGKLKYVVEPQGAAGWAWLNNFNLNHRRSNNNQSYDTRMEWLMKGNIGGGDGVNFSGAVFADDSSDGRFERYRGDWLLFIDAPDKPRRISFGDTQNRVVGHLGSYQLGGVAIESAYGQLQPQRNLTPGNSQVFVLPRYATIEVFVNGFMLSRVRLKPGRYNINDLPLTSGSNQIRIVATYNDGEVQEFDFAKHYNAQLLSEGLSDYALVLGRPSTVLANVYHYDASYLLSGSYEYGWSDALTVGVNGAASKAGGIWGVSATTGARWGNVSMRLSQSQGETETGLAFSLESEHSVFGQSNFGSPNLRLGYHYKQDFSTTPWQLGSQQISERRVNLDYSYYLNDHIDVGLFGALKLDAFDNKSKELTAQGNWRYEGLNVSFGYSYSSGQSALAADGKRFFLNFTWSLYDTKDGTRQRLRYTSRNETFNATHTKVNRNYLGDYGYELSAEKGNGFGREQLRGSYTARAIRTDINIDNTKRDGQVDRANMSVNLSTSIGLADGQVGVGTNVTAPFVVLNKHKSLGKVPVLVNVNRQNKAQTQTGGWFGALVSLGSAYNPSHFNIDVPDAPLGYDWGPGAYNIAGGATTGHVVQVGSAFSYTVMGVLLDDKGQPVALKRGIVKQTGHEFSKTFFTNRAGRFVVEGIGSGTFTLEIEGLLGEFTVDDTELRFIDIGDIQLEVKP